MAERLIRHFASSILLVLFATSAWAVAYEYDDLNRLTSATYPSGQVLTYSYDATGNLLSITSVTPGPTVSDVTALVSVQISGLRLNRATRRYYGYVAVENTSGGPLNGPVHFQFSGLSDFATVVNANGQNEGSPYLTVAPTGLAMGERQQAIVDFALSARQLPDYTPQVFNGEF